MNRVFTDAQSIEKQTHFDMLANWAETWQMSFNLKKCTVLQYGYRNENVNYLLNGTEAKFVDRETDLGVTKTSTASPIRKCSEVVSL